MSNSWYPRYYGDYMRDTGLLSLVQHGAYTCLLDHYYATGAPIPDSIDAVCRMCRAVSSDEQEAVKTVLTMFFTLADDGYHNARADREIAKANAISTARAEAGSAGAKAKWQAHGKRHGKKMAIATTSTSTSTIPQAQPNPSSICPAKPDFPTEFEECWAIYPDKSGKAKARDAYIKARKNGTAQQDVLAGLNRYIAYVADQRRSGFSDLKYQNGSTWFNQRGWESEYAVSKPAEEVPEWIRKEKEERRRKWAEEEQKEQKS